MRIDDREAVTALDNLVQAAEAMLRVSTGGGKKSTLEAYKATGGALGELVKGYAAAREEAQKIVTQFRTPSHKWKDGKAVSSNSYEKFKEDGKTRRCQGTVHIDWLYGKQCKFAAKYDRRTKCKIHSKAGPATAA